jgi:aerobic-type carbon monoxide dehydrogenase small subunit (CoxS/CutS family)
MADRPADPISASTGGALVAGQGRSAIALTINGAPVELEAAPDRRLLDVLRDDLGLTGTKSGCEIGVCGACSVIVDGRLQSACLLLVGLLEGRSVVTIEGLGTPDEPSPVQRAFVEAGGFQCGICTPGQVVAATALLDEVEAPSDETIRRWMAGNLCRCTGYASIVESVRLAAGSVASASRGRGPAADGGPA